MAKMAKRSIFVPEDVVYNKPLGPCQLGQEASPAAAHFPLHQIHPDTLELHLFRPDAVAFRWSRPFPHTERDGRAEHGLKSPKLEPLGISAFVTRAFCVAVHRFTSMQEKHQLWWCHCCLFHSCRCLQWDGCQLEQGWWELADRKSLWQQVLRIWCLPKNTCQRDKALLVEH